MEVAPGIRRIGTGMANVYLFGEAGAVTIVNAGVPGYWGALPASLAAMGRTLEDVRAVVLTHAHTDHIGFAERIRTERGVPNRVHELDALRAKGQVPGPKGLGDFKRDAGCPGRAARHPRSGPHRRKRRAALRAARCDLRRRCLRDSKCHQRRNGPAALPNFNSDNEQAYASLARFEGIEARFVLAGHGDVWDGGLAEAVRVARESWTTRR